MNPTNLDLGTRDGWRATAAKGSSSLGKLRGNHLGFEANIHEIASDGLQEEGTT